MFSRDIDSQVIIIDACFCMLHSPINVGTNQDTSDISIGNI